MLAEGRQGAFHEFVHQYETVRLAEGRRMQNPTHLRALPFRDLSRTRSYEWHIRSRSYQALIRRVVEPIERRRGRTLRIADLGSGLGWLAYRLALRGHDVAAVDLLTNDFDGLGVHRQYGCAFASIQAEFDRLPFVDASFDLVVYGAAFHYAKEYVATLTEALRVLRNSGFVIIMDTPIYQDGSSGVRMVQEREAMFHRQHGFRGTATESFLTYDRLAELEDKLPLRWALFEPWYGLGWWFKPWIARVRGLREPARFKLVLGYPRSSRLNEALAFRRLSTARPRG